MVPTLKHALIHLSFSRQFMLAIISVLVIGMLIIGSWIAHLIENNAVNRAASISAVYLESISTAQLNDWQKGGILATKTHAELDRIFVNGPLRREVLRLKLWDGSGRIVYSNDHAQIGLHFPVKGPLAAALAGEVRSRITDLNDSDDLPEQARWKRLLEVHVPIRSHTTDEIIAVAEFYLSADALQRDIRAAQQRSWALVAASTFGIYLLLFSLVRRANNTINEQRRDLQLQLQQLRKVLDENELMRESLRQAGVSTTTLNEELLLRIAADLHDGPAQTLAFALMRFDEFAANCRGCASSPANSAQELRSIHSALESSLRDVRKISSGLVMPEMNELPLADVARRAVRDFEHLSGKSVRIAIDAEMGEAPLSVKITVYRLLQESLNNCWRHTPCCSPLVQVRRTDGEVVVSVADDGAGFDPQAAAVGGRLGLAFMRERVRLLGGIFEIDSAPGHGTTIRARLPLSTNEMIHV